MKVNRTSRGFQILDHETYGASDIQDKVGKEHQILSQSSAIGDYDDSFDRPGSSYLWVGEYHHLNREEVGELVAHLQAWLKTGSLELNAEEKEVA